MQIFRKSLVKTFISYSVITSFVGLNFTELALAAQAASASEAAKNASANLNSGNYSDSDLDALRALSLDAQGKTSANFSGVVSGQESLDQNDPRKVNLLGKDSDRSYGNSHEPLINGGTDMTIGTQSQMFKTQIANDEDSPEGRAYRHLNDIGNNPGYHTRDKDNKSFGDRLTLIVEDSEIVDEYKRLAADAEDGTMCRVVVTKPEVSESVARKINYDCTFSNYPIYARGSCSVGRTLIIPNAASGAGMTLSKSVGSTSTTHTGTFTYPHDVALNKKLKFKLEQHQLINATLNLSAAITDPKQFILVNGHKIDGIAGINNISSFLKAGENIIEARSDNGQLLPTNQASDYLANYFGISEATSLCSVNDDGVMDGILKFGDLQWGGAGSNVDTYGIPISTYATTGACPSGYFMVGYDTNTDRAKHAEGQSVKRCFKPYNEPVCEAIDQKYLSLANNNPSKAEFLQSYDRIRNKIINPGPAIPHNFNWPTFAQTKHTAQTSVEVPLMTTHTNLKVVPLDGRGNFKDICNHVGAYGGVRSIYIFSNGGLYGQLTAETTCYDVQRNREGWNSYYDGLTAYSFRNMACWNGHRHNGQSANGPCRVPSLEGALSAYDKWNDSGIFISNEYAAGTSLHALNSARYAMGQGHATINVTLKLNHVNAVETKTQTPPQCADRSSPPEGVNQVTADSNGELRFGLIGQAFKYTDTASAPSTNNWRCEDYSPNRLHGTHIQTPATSSLVYGSISNLFPGDKGSNQVCYRAIAPNYAIDITDESCPDGTLSCWSDRMDGLGVDECPEGEVCYGAVNSASTSKADEQSYLAKVLSKITIFNQAHAAVVATTGRTLGEALRDNECTPYESNSECRLIEEGCSDVNAITGECQYVKRKYECNEYETVVTQVAEVETICDSPIPCSNTDDTCKYDNSGDFKAFQEAATLLSVAQLADGDKNCLDAGDVSTCTMFTGRAASCTTRKNAISSGCCDRPSGAPGPFEYVKAIYMGYKTDYVQKTLANIGTSITNSGFWTEYVKPVGDFIRQSATQAVDKVKNWFVSESAAAAQQTTTTAVADISAEAASQGILASMGASARFMGARALEGVSNVVGKWLVEDVIRNEATGAVVGKISEGAVAGAGEVASVALNSNIAGAIGTAIAVVGWVYMAYMLAKLAYSILTACDQSEFETAYSVGTSSCVKVVHKECTGSNTFGCYERTNRYCCYNSMLARIIHEEARRTGQLPGSWDDQLANGCPGISIGDFSSLNFDPDNGGISLEEWTDALIKAGQIPDGTSNSMKDFTDIDHLTKSVARTNDDYDADPSKYKNALQRTEEVVETSAGNYEDYRSVDRDLLIMGEMYSEQYESCTGSDRYLVDNGNAYFTRKAYVMYADGEKHYTGACYPDPASPAFPILSEACGDASSGKTIKYFLNEAGYRIDVSQCE